MAFLLPSYLVFQKVKEVSLHDDKKFNPGKW